MKAEQLQKMREDLIVMAEDLISELKAPIENKSAAGRARKLTLNMNKLGKDFRSGSIEFAKK